MTMAIPSIPPIGSVTQPIAPGPSGPAAPGFADALRGGLEHVSRLEHDADAITQSVATGGPAGVGDLMVATTKASLGVDLLVQVRNRAVEAYQEIMRLPV
jgi:flagellar hook-basal body complex protein FliE